MARSGTPKGGRDEIAERTYVAGGDFTLVAYTNTPDSLGDETLASHLVQPSGPGYAPIVLNGTWTSDDGLVEYSHPGHPTWTALGAWSAPVTGAALIYGSRVVHFHDYNDAGDSWVAANGRKLAVDITELVG